MTAYVSKNEKTKYRLADSVKQCMMTTPVDKITVQNIVDGCDMTRQTFYRNFKDKYDLINWYFDKLVLESFARIGVEKTVCQSLEVNLSRRRRCSSPRPSVRMITTP